MLIPDFTLLMACLMWDLAWDYPRQVGAVVLDSQLTESIIPSYHISINGLIKGPPGHPLLHPTGSLINAQGVYYGVYGN